jgi:hypothetical protein
MCLNKINTSNGSEWTTNHTVYECIVTPLIWRHNFFAFFFYTIDQIQEYFVKGQKSLFRDEVRYIWYRKQLICLLLSHVKNVKNPVVFHNRKKREKNVN